MINKIIVPLDGSQIPEVSLPYVEEQAGRLNAEIILLVVIQPNDIRSRTMLESYLEKLSTQVKEGARKYQKVGTIPVVVKTRVLTGDPAEEIIAFADKEEGSKICMATHGKSGLTRFPIGSVTDKVIRTTIRPVSVIRVKDYKSVHKQGYFQKILAPMDGSKESEGILPYLEEIALAMNAEITFLHVLKEVNVMVNLQDIKVAEENMETMKDYLEKLTSLLNQKGLKVNYEMLEISGKDVADEINRYSHAHSIDTIVMATHGRSGAKRWILGSVALKVLIEGNTPMTLIRSKANI
jgi:nucleotide-binding universal stress UspA family protein